MLFGCAEAELAAHVAAMNTPRDQARYHIGAPYERGGHRIVPEERFVYDEIGLASWYGPGLHGRRTANGEIFDRNGLTAAHPTLQLPAIALVTNLDNGRSVRVRINDRGPQDPDRLIDVSQRTAELLGFKRQGVVRVRVRVLSEDSLALRRDLTRQPDPIVAAATPTTSPASAPVRTDAVADRPDSGRDAAKTDLAASSPVWLDAGAFAERSGAEAVVPQADTIAPATLSPVRVDGTDYWRVRLGPFHDVATAESALEAAWNAGFSEARLVAR